MITDSYSKMVSDFGMRSMLQSNNNEELGFLLREQKRQQEMSERERELNMYRSGSAPPTVEGSLNAVGGLLAGAGGGISEEELRSDPAYISYYYANVNLNPRLPPPLLSKEDWRFAQRLQGGGSSAAIGDRRKINRDDGGNSSRSLFSLQPEMGQQGSNAEWGGDGLIGLPGLGLGSRQKSIAEIIQVNLVVDDDYMLFWFEKFEILNCLMLMTRVIVLLFFLKLIVYLPDHFVICWIKFIVN